VRRWLDAVVRLSGGSMEHEHELLRPVLHVSQQEGGEGADRSGQQVCGYRSGEQRVAARERGDETVARQESWNNSIADSRVQLVPTFLPTYRFFAKIVPLQFVAPHEHG